MSELSEIEQARARGRVYAILAKLLVDGLDADTLAQLRALDGWLLDDARSYDLDELAAAHHACFHLDLFPYAGVFLDRSAVAGGRSDMVFAYFERAGFRPRLDQLTADHLGVMLGFMSFVSAACSEARDDHQMILCVELEQLTAEFLDASILSWLPSMVAAIDTKQAGLAFWPNVLRETLEFAAAHRMSLRERYPTTSVPELPDPEHDLLDDPGTGLRRIAEHLLCPAHSGVFLTRADIAWLGRERALPRGFGSRVIMLDNLLHSAVDYGLLGALLLDLRALLVTRDQTLADLGAELALEAFVAPWRQALARTLELVSTLDAASR
jgi:putative dimethyl sulfoxide reductase chaperone